MRAIDVISALSTLGALPSVLNFGRQCTRYAITWLQRPPLPLRLAILLTCMVSLLTLHGCAPAVLRAPSPPHADIAADSPSNIRMMGADHRFANVSIGSVARRAHYLRAGEPFSILALSGGGADGAFGAGALVGLTNAGGRPPFSVVTGVSAGPPGSAT